FSSRRRHTRFSRDWSSDVCSSDLKYGNSENTAQKEKVENLLSVFTFTDQKKILEIARNNITSTEFSIENSQSDLLNKQKNIYSRSEERRVGKERRSREETEY